jgi:hypothetical protein
MEESNVYESFFMEMIQKKIYNQIRKTHGYGKLEIHFPCPLVFWEKISVNWMSYIPQKRKNGYHFYKKCERLELFVNTFQNVDISKTFCLRDQQKITMKILINEETPSRMIFNSKKKKLILTFWYEPYPYLSDWEPMYRERNGEPLKAARVNWNKVQQYWIDKDNN